jgi:hypothetical protein
MRWQLSYRADPHGRPIADSHYNRQKIGSKQFVPPGRCLVLVIPDVALWVTSWPFPEYVKHAWPGAWINSTFRNQLRRPDGTAVHLTSELALEAIAATRRFWDPPEQGLVSFIDPKKTKHKRDPGRSYFKAGFRPATPRTTEGGLIAVQMLPQDMPAPWPHPLVGEQLELVA